MPAAKRQNGPRDTAKDIILGLAPSGQGPRQPREGVASRQKRSNSYDSRPRVESPAYKPTVVVDRRPDNSAINGLQAQLQQLQMQNKELLANEQAARRRLEANQDALNRRMMSSDNGVSTREVDDLKRQLITADGKIMTMASEINSLRSNIDRQASDMMHINNEMKSRPVVDPSKIATSTQQLDGKIRDLHGQLMQMKQQLDSEKNERAKEARQLSDTINRLQDIIRQQDQSKNEILNNISKKGDKDKEKLTEESKRLNEKINLITTEVTRNLGEGQSRMRDEMHNKYAALESALKVHGETISQLDNESRRNFEQSAHSQTQQLDAMNRAMQTDRAKQKDRFQKVNEALAALEHHLELGNKKMDKIVNSEIQTRKLHEKGLLSKIQDVEDKITSYMGGLNKSIDDVKAGKDVGRLPQLDVDALRREMEAIAADKNKLSMEGLLKLEEKMSRVQQGAAKTAHKSMSDSDLSNTLGMHHDKKDLSSKMSDLSLQDQARLKTTMGKLDALQNDMDKVQDRIRDKVERQIPQDLNELSAKADNMKHQLNARIDKEEEERYLAIKELQEAFQRLQGKGVNLEGVEGASHVRRDVDECKTAIKKLAESLTTVKNVLDKKITDESKQREREIASLSKR